VRRSPRRQLAALYTSSLYFASLFAQDPVLFTQAKADAHKEYGAVVPRDEPAAPQPVIAMLSDLIIQESLCPAGQGGRSQKFCCYSPPGRQPAVTPAVFTHLVGSFWFTPRFLCLQAKADARAEYGAAVPRDGSLLHHLLRAHNKETGKPFSELQIMAQGNTFLLAGAAIEKSKGCIGIH